MIPNTQKTQASILPPEAEEQLEQEIKSFMAGRDLELYRIMEYHLGYSNDKGGPQDAPIDRRRHAGLTLATAQALYGDYKPLLKYAISVELLHNFSLIHADVQDGNENRTGRPSIWWKWGPAQAINTGDGMHALARLAIFQLHEQGQPVDKVSKALEIIDSATLKMCEGEYLDALYQERSPPVSVDEYMDMAERRVGALYGAAAELAAIHQQDKPESAEALRTFGIKIGTAKLITADFLSLFAENQRDPIQQGRIINKKKTLSIAYLFNNTDNPTLLRRAGEIYMKRLLDPSEISELTEIASETGARSFTLQKAKNLIQEAETSLHKAGIKDESAQNLIDFACDIADIHMLPDN